jgi:hypothetical protein
VEKSKVHRAAPIGSDAQGKLSSGKTRLNDWSIRIDALLAHTIQIEKANSLFSSSVTTTGALTDERHRSLLPPSPFLVRQFFRCTIFHLSLEYCLLEEPASWLDPCLIGRQRSLVDFSGK